MYERTQEVHKIVEDRRLILGPTDRVRGLSLVKYKWAREMWLLLKANNWIPEEISLKSDTEEYRQLPQNVKDSFDKSLAFLSNLDAIQVDNLAENILHCITDPTVSDCIKRQIYEEVIHVEAYGTIIETVIPDPERIYDMYNVVSQLENKNKYIVSSGNAVKNNEITPVSFLKAAVSNVALEGIYFYSGFLTFYAIGNRTGKMQGVVDQIKYINRDEICHMHLFSLIYHTVQMEYNEVLTDDDYEEFRNIIRNAVELEISWGRFVVGEGVCGITTEGIEQYIKYLANERSYLLGLGTLYEGITNPYPFVSNYELINNRQGNFFERKVDTYSSKNLSFKRN